VPWRNPERNGASFHCKSAIFGTPQSNKTFSLSGPDVIGNFEGHPEEASVRKTKLLSTIAMALLLGAGAASAQGMSKEPPERAPAAQQKAPAEKMAPSIKADDHKSPQTTGQSPKSEAPDKAGAIDKDKSSAPGTSDMRSKSEQSGGSSKSTTGQGAASGSAKLSTEQRTKITTIFKQHKVEPTKLNVSVSVGTRIPASVHLYPIPVQVVEVYPEWRDFDYILVGDQIVVVNPRTHEIVAILEA
jgi:hypothetical protein